MLRSYRVEFCIVGKLAIGWSGGLIELTKFWFSLLCGQHNEFSTPYYIIGLIFVLTYICSFNSSILMQISVRNDVRRPEVCVEAKIGGLYGTK